MLTEARWRQPVPKPHRKWSPPCAIRTPYLPLHMTPARYQGHTCGQGQRGGCWAHQGTLRCPLLALQCWGCFSHLSGDPVLSLCLPLVMMHCPLLLPLPELWLGQADCYSSCISSSQASGFLKQPRVLGPLQAGGSGLSLPVPGPAPARSQGTMQRHRAVQAQPWPATGFLCHPQRLCLPVWLFSISILPLSGSRASLGTSLSPLWTCALQAELGDNVWPNAPNLPGCKTLWGLQFLFAWSIPAGTGSCWAGKGQCDCRWSQL